MWKFSSYFSVYKQIARTDLKAVKEGDNNEGRAGGVTLLKCSTNDAIIKLELTRNSTLISKTN